MKTKIKKVFASIKKSILVWWKCRLTVVDFKHRNIIFAEDQEEYISLPAYLIKEAEGRVISCWAVSFKDRLRILFTGRIWLSSMTFNKPLTPVSMAADPRELYSHPDFVKIRGKSFIITQKIITILGFIFLTTAAIIAIIVRPLVMLYKFLRDLNNIRKQNGRTKK